MNHSQTVFRSLLPHFARTLADSSAGLPDLSSVLPDHQDVSGLPVWAAAQRIAPVFYYLLKESPQARQFPPAVLGSLREEYYRAVFRSDQLEKELSPVLQALTAAEIPVILLKGAALARTVYPRRFLRPMVDVDLLVRPEALDRAWQVFMESGYQTNQISTSYPLSFVKGYTSEQSFSTAQSGQEGILFDLHWKIIPVQWCWYPSRVDADALWECARPLAGYSTPVLQLSPEDTLLHLCIHAAVHHAWAVPAISYLDIDQVIRANQDNLDWDLLVSRVYAFRVALPLYFGLSLTQQYFETPLPPKLLRTLQIPQPRTWLIRRIIGANQNPLYERNEPVQSTLNLLRLLLADRILDNIEVVFKIFFPGKQWLSARYNLQGKSAVQMAARFLLHPLWVFWFGLSGLGQTARRLNKKGSTGKKFSWKKT